jgi:hypothetical protein
MRARLRLVGLRVRPPPQSVQTEGVEGTKQRLVAMRAAGHGQLGQLPEIRFLRRSHLGQSLAGGAVPVAVDEGAAGLVDAQLDRHVELRGMFVHPLVVRRARRAVTQHQFVALCFCGRGPILSHHGARPFSSSIGW